jgi:hypothetical protein
MRRWQPYVIGAAVSIVGVALILGIVLQNRGRVGNPSAGVVRAAVAREVGGSCPSGIEVRDIPYIGGPGLPDGMRKAREIVCKAEADAARDVPEDMGGHPRIAVQYVFSSAAEAKDWMHGANYQGGDWWLHDGTLVAAVDLDRGEWGRVVADLHSRTTDR